MNGKPQKSFITFPLLHCVKCGHQWVSRIKTKPVRCPRCITPNWEKGSKRDQAEAKERARA